YFDASQAILFGDPNQVGGFVAAGRAPRGPEINHQDLAPVIGELDGPAINSGYREIRERVLSFHGRVALDSHIRDGSDPPAGGKHHVTDRSYKDGYDHSRYNAAGRPHTWIRWLGLTAHID